MPMSTVRNDRQSVMVNTFLRHWEEQVVVSRERALTFEKQGADFRETTRLTFEKLRNGMYHWMIKSKISRHFFFS